MSEREGMPEQDHYRVLGVGEGTTEEEITRAWRRLAQRYHLDHNAGPGASQAFSEAASAYEVLGDPTRRRRYDAARRLGSVLPGRRIPVHHARSSQTVPTTSPELPVSFAQAVLGAEVPLQVETPERCGRCGGRGATGEEPPCPSCQGQGSLRRRSGPLTIRLECRTCRGRGHLSAPACPGCEGRGWVLATEMARVEVPPGTEDGDRLRLLGQAGPEDLWITARVQSHPFFSRRGPDLVLSLPITLAEAALGATIPVPTLEAGPVSVEIPPGTGHGKVLRVPGQGVPADGGRGDLVVLIEVAVPARLNPAQRAALEVFAAATASPRPTWRYE